MDLNLLKELSIGVASLLIIGGVVLYLTKNFLKALKDQRETASKELQDTREDFCKLMSNHIAHETTAIENLDKTMQKNTLVLSKISIRITKKK